MINLVIDRKKYEKESSLGLHKTSVKKKDKNNKYKTSQIK